MKTIKQIVIVMALMVIALTISAPIVQITQATGVLPLPNSSAYGQVVAANSQAGGSAEVQFNNLVFGIVNNVRYIIGAVAILMAVYAGFRMVIGAGDEAVYTKQKNTLLYAVIGLAVVGLAGEMGKIFQVGCSASSTTPCVEGGFLKDPNAIIRTATLFNTRTQIIVIFIKYFIGAVAVAEIITSGLRMITMGSAEEKLARDKKNLAYGAIGLILIILSDNIINNVFYKIDLTRYPSVGGAAPAVDAARGVSELVGITNFIVTLVGPLAILAMIIAGILYITAAGKEEQTNKAKKLMFASLLGIIIIYGSFAIVSTFISGSFGEPTSTQQVQNAASSGTQTGQ